MLVTSIREGVTIGNNRTVRQMVDILESSIDDQNQRNGQGSAVVIVSCIVFVVSGGIRREVEAESEGGQSVSARNRRRLPKTARRTTTGRQQNTRTRVGQNGTQVAA